MGKVISYVHLSLLLTICPHKKGSSLDTGHSISAEYPAFSVGIIGVPVKHTRMPDHMVYTFNRDSLCSPTLMIEGTWLLPDSLPIHASVCRIENLCIIQATTRTKLMWAHRFSLKSHLSSENCFSWLKYYWSSSVKFRFSLLDGFSSVKNWMHLS